MKDFKSNLTIVKILQDSATRISWRRTLVLLIWVVEKRIKTWRKFFNDDFKLNETLVLNKTHMGFCVETIFQYTKS